MEDAVEITNKFENQGSRSERLLGIQGITNSSSDTAWGNKQYTEIIADYCCTSEVDVTSQGRQSVTSL